MSDHVIIEASEPHNGCQDRALTIAWPDGRETIELVSNNAAEMLGFRAEDDGSEGPSLPLTDAQQATLDLHARRVREEAAGELR